MRVPNARATGSGALLFTWIAKIQRRGGPAMEFFCTKGNVSLEYVKPRSRLRERTPALSIARCQSFGKALSPTQIRVERDTYALSIHTIIPIFAIRAIGMVRFLGNFGPALGVHLLSHKLSKGTHQEG